MDKTGNISNVFSNPSPTLILPLPEGGGGFWGIPTLILPLPLGGED